MVAFMTTEPDTRPLVDEKTLMGVFNLPLLEARFLRAMLEHEWVGKEELPAIQYSVRQLTYKLRTKLGAMDPSIWVVNDNKGRYGITWTGRQAIRQIIEKATLGVRHED